MRTRWPLVLALCSGYFLVLLDVTVVNVALPQIGAGLGASGSALAWVVDAYAVPLAALLLASGAIGDRIGHRRVVLLGFALFGTASVLCATAPSIGVLVAARAVQGVGAALMLPGTLALLVEHSGGEGARNRLVGLWAAVGGAALPAGPVIGGLLVQAAGWRAVFWLSVPVLLAAVVPVLRLPHTAPVERSGRMDWAGAALLVTGLACLVSAIIEGPGAMGWGLALGAAALGIAVCFVVVERRSVHPLVDVPQGARGALFAASGVAGLMNLCVLGALFLLTQLFQDVRGLTPLLAGLATLPAMLPMPLLGVPAGRLCTRIGVWATSALGLGIAAAGFAGVAATVTGAGHVLPMLFLALWGAGIGILTPAIVAAALRTAPHAPGAASGVSNTSRQIGGALGVAVFAAVAGSAADAGFSSRASGLFLAAALVFVVVGVACGLAARRTATARA